MSYIYNPTTGARLWAPDTISGADELQSFRSVYGGRYGTTSEFDDLRQQNADKDIKIQELAHQLE